MSTAKVCKKCPHFVAGKSWCVKDGVYRSPWDDYCDPQMEIWKAGQLK